MDMISKYHHEAALQLVRCPADSGTVTYIDLLIDISPVNKSVIHDLTPVRSKITAVTDWNPKVVEVFDCQPHNILEMPYNILPGLLTRIGDGLEMCRLPCICTASVVCGAEVFGHTGVAGVSILRELCNQTIKEITIFDSGAHRSCVEEV
jgi:hypothetical protein